MKKYISDFVLRGLIAAAGGPVVLGIIYGILGATGEVTALNPMEVCQGILSITLMAFIAAGITMIYTVDRLPIISAILIHAAVLYLDYLILYLCNNWIQRDVTTLGIFTGIFFGGFTVIWVIVYFCNRAKIKQLNQLRKKAE